MHMYWFKKQSLNQIACVNNEFFYLLFANFTVVGAVVWSRSSNSLLKVFFYTNKN